MGIIHEIQMLLFIYLFLSTEYGLAEDGKKRILVNDPSFVEQRLSHMESLIQQLQTDLSKKSLEITQLQTDLSGKNLDISLLKNTIPQLQTYLNGNASKINQLQTNLNSKYSEIAQLQTDLNGKTSEISQLKATIQQLSHQVQKTTNQDGGAVFTRWGRMDCPNGTETVYSGFSGGGFYTHTGAAVDYLCLPRDPNLGAAVSGGSYIYGVEYQTNFWKSDSVNEDAPCSVCRSIMHTTTMMLPGRNLCYKGWTLQYAGHLGSGNSGHASSHRYACVDKEPHYLSGGEGRDTDGALFYPVTAQCGTLQCPPYKQDRWITCAVCTR